jgi:hypothetical protein
MKILVLCLLMLPNSAEAARETFALGRNLDTTILDEAIQQPSKDLVGFMEKAGVEVYLYPSRAKRNPHFSGARFVPQRLRDEPTLRNLFEDSGGGSTVADVGIFIPKEDTDLGQYGTFIVIAESATVHTLLHEFTHFVFYTTEQSNRGIESIRSDKYNLADRAWRAQRNLMLQLGYGLQNYVSSDVYKRENLVESVLNDFHNETERIHWFVAEEVIVEALLASRVGSKSSIHYTEGRVKKGQEYALRNINGARMELSRRLHTWDELRHSFMRTAGAHEYTSNAEREEIVESIPVYNSMIDQAVLKIENKLSELQALIKKEGFRQ